MHIKMDQVCLDSLACIQPVLILCICTCRSIQTIHNVHVHTYVIHTYVHVVYLQSRPLRANNLTACI